ncbi:MULTISPECIES: HAMP domain-containing sensor histidine kinase [unclassified Streptomyces]|uniref:sensor histidine kinase n=1 Tax=unclassified Streptomyces TaxID=2593676 RepID=UPI0006FAFB02|nr:MULTISPECIES: HAMP domain-containing sensor histidine kinase [unclassified Streptomyces]KQX53133.1 histidine kinase [Streptomyces sp. Root1304]KRA90054.1 histidine kinase [Streptomyces sp. Root66D1]
MPRRPGLSVRMKLTLSYAGFLAVAGALLLAVVWAFLLRYVPDTSKGLLGISPNRYLLVRTFAPAAAIAMAFLLVFGLVGGWLLAGRMLAPLTRITAAARLAGSGSLSHRVGMEGRRDEFRELADAFDTMLEQLESHVDEQQRFAANASHELRTPLAISQALLDVARRDPTRDRAELLERLQAVNTRAIDLTEALLLLSRSGRGNVTRERVDLSLVAEEAAETLLPLAEQRGITLTVTGGATPVGGSAQLLLRMVTNLVQNAVVHNLPAGPAGPARPARRAGRAGPAGPAGRARPAGQAGPAGPAEPAGGIVTVHTEARGDTGVLRVENTGRPVPPELVPALIEPFRRGTERVRTDEHAGVGLGLAIVQSIVRAHDGTLELVPRPEGGLRVTVRLPGAPSGGEPAR